MTDEGTSTEETTNSVFIFDKSLLKKGYTALHQAAEQGCIHKLTELLNANGKDLNRQSSDGYTPLMLAAQENHIEAVELLLKQPQIDTLIENDFRQNAYSIGRKNNNKNLNQLLYNAMVKQREKACGITEQEIIALLAFKAAAEEFLPSKTMQRIKQVAEQNIPKIAQKFTERKRER